MYNSCKVLSFFLLICCCNTAVHAFDPYLSPRLGMSLATLQTALEKVAGPVTFAPRPDNPKTQEVRLRENIGIVQAAGDTGNLNAVVLWLPVDARNPLVSPKTRPYLVAFVELFSPESEFIVRWVGEVTTRAVADTANPTYVEAQFVGKYQLKATYTRTLSPPMLSLTVVMAGE